MNTQSTCPNCGRSLAPDSPRGLCPECLMRSGFGTGAAPEPGETARRPSFTPPSLGEMAKLFPQLEIVELLGQGGMGAVYKARQPGLDRWVALKILPPRAAGQAGFAQRFNREARALARLNHANIVAVYEFGQAGGMPYFVMEYVEGVTLRRLVEERRLPPRDALRIVPQICEALQFAHEEGVVHRDIKPENILLDKKGRVKIADFGIAKIVGEAGQAEAAQIGRAAQAEEGRLAADSPQPAVSLTQDQVLGTPHYMAPEQIEHPQAVDHRADIYSLGVVFYEMLTGELPVGKFQPPSKRAQLDVRLDEVVLHTLEKEPQRRYQHASEIKKDVETIARTTGGAAPSADAPGVARALEEVRSPASWLLATGILNWIAIPTIVLAAAWIRNPGGLPAAPMLLPLLAALGLSSFIIFAGLKMRRLEAYSTAVMGSIFAMLVTPGNIIGLPVGIWSLVVLSRREVRQAFGRGHIADGVVSAGTAPAAPAPDRFWRRFAVAVALVLLALILIPVFLTLLSITLPTLARARMKAQQDAATILAEAVPAKPSADTPAGGAGAGDNVPAGVMAFGPVIDRVLYSVAVQRPIKGEDLDNGREIEVPAEIEKAGEEQFFHWLAAQGVDLLAFAHKQSWDLWAAPKLSSVPSGLWDRPVESELKAALESGAAGLTRTEPDEKQGFVSYSLGKDVVLPLTFAFQTRADAVGLLQIVEFTDSPRGIRIRYKLVIERAPWVRGEIGGIALKPRSQDLCNLID
ncbi:MAG: serine/threonine protein kinase [Verrucomicrobia bacterium]|nr:serine/threonine protein kinase [Verrucomicrobiota bacterium]